MKQTDYDKLARAFRDAIPYCVLERRTPKEAATRVDAYMGALEAVARNIGETAQGENPRFNVEDFLRACWLSN